RAINTAMMAMTTSSSISVKARRDGVTYDGVLIVLHSLRDKVFGLTTVRWVGAPRDRPGPDSRRDFHHVTSLGWPGPLSLPRPSFRLISVPCSSALGRIGIEAIRGWPGSWLSQPETAAAMMNRATPPCPC